MKKGSICAESDQEIEIKVATRTVLSDSLPRGYDQRMKYLLLSDIHSNLPALEAVLWDVEKRFHDWKEWSVICLGDLIGYMASPNEVIDHIWPICDHVVLGNHELMAVDYLMSGESALKWFRPSVAAATRWTAEQLTHRNRERLFEHLRRGHLTYTRDHLLMTHADPIQPGGFSTYIMNLRQARDRFLGQSRSPYRVVFVGHVHKPQLYCVDEQGQLEDDRVPRNIRLGLQEFDLSADRKSLVVVPAVGQPRDRDPRAGYAVYDDLKQQLSFIRVPYDIEAAQKRMRETDGLGSLEFLIERLKEGR